MSAPELKVQIIFQSKINEGIACSTDTVQMHPADIKQLKVKPGALVIVDMNSSTIICKVWPSKKSTQGVATLNKLWMPNFTNENRKAKISPALTTTSVYGYIFPVSTSFTYALCVISPVYE
jgi:formylmethanofuran dehydrogenase subunit D